jgi:hypothetical protein
MRPIQNRDAIAQPLGFLHQVRRQKHGLAALPDAADEVPDGAPRLRIQPGRELVQKHNFRIVDPAPFGPTRPKISPGSTANDTSANASNWPYRFRMFST